MMIVQGLGFGVDRRFIDPQAEPAPKQTFAEKQAARKKFTLTRKEMEALDKEERRLLKEQEKFADTTKMLIVGGVGVGVLALFLVFRRKTGNLGMSFQSKKGRRLKKKGVKPGRRGR